MLKMNRKSLCCATLAIGLPHVGTLVNFACRHSNKHWYKRLKKPWFTPPDWEFDHFPAFYELLGFSSILVYVQNQCGVKGSGQALLSYAVNLGLNWAWSPIFFSLKRLDLAFYELLLLDLSTITTGYLFYRVHSLAGYLVVPYGLWLGLCTALNYRIYKDNSKRKRIK